MYMKPTVYNGTTTPDTQPRKNMITVGKVDTSELMMIIRYVINTFSRSHKLEWDSLTHTTHDITHSNAMTTAEHKSDFELTKYIPYLTLTDELWAVFCEDFGKKGDRTLTARSMAQIHSGVLQKDVNVETSFGGVYCRCVTIIYLQLIKLT